MVYFALTLFWPNFPVRDKENLLFQEVWCPLADLYKDRITAPKPKGKGKGKGKK